MARIVGIDLGTTNSLVAYMNGKTPTVIPGPDGRTLVPSIVASTPSGFLTGDAAKEQLVRNPEHTVYSVKRFMGKGLSDVTQELRYFPFKLTEQNGVIRLQIGNKSLTPPEISAMVLKELKARAEAFFGEEIRKAVITVPAYFNDSQRQATKDAGKIAGLEVVRIVNERPAASLAYGLQKRTQGIIAVYALGGGTSDHSTLKLKSGIFEVLATNGNTHPGGDAFDRRLVDVMMQDLKAKHGLSVEGRPELQQELRVRAEQAKCRLSSDTEAVVEVPLPDGKSRYRRTFTRTELEKLVDDLVEKTLAPCRQALADAGLTATDVDEVVLVGGSTRMPLVQQRVQALFGKTPHCELNPDEGVALGPPVPAGVPRIEVTFMLDANGILSVTARDVRTGEVQSIEVKPSYGLTDQEVERMIRDSFVYAKQDIQERQRIEAMNEAESMLRATEKALARAGNLATPEERAAVREAVANLKSAMAGADHRAIREAIDKLDKASYSLAEKLMNSTLQEALKDKKLSDV